MQVKKNQIVSLSIEGISSDGNGLGRVLGMVVFVPNSTVGDQLLVKIVKVCKNHAFGKIEEITKAGPGRIVPDCPISATCGGCCFRHMEYGAELLAKQMFVQDAVNRIGGLSCQALPIIESPQINRYRNKVQYPLAKGQNEEIIYGFYSARSHRLVPCQDCLLQPMELNQLAKDIAKILHNIGATPYDESTKTGLLRHITLRQSVYGGQVLVCLVLNANSLPKKQSFIAQLTALHPNVGSIVLNKNTGLTNVIYGKTSRAIYGQGYVEDSLCGVPMQLWENTFAQVNTPAAEILFGIVGQFAAPNSGTILLDLYCGTGVIGLSLAKHCKLVIGVELFLPAVESAQKTAKKMGLCNTRFICADAKKALPALAKEGLAPDVVILDPPRSGVCQEALSAILSMHPARIVMVSCNPATMARDLSILAKAGYCLVKLQAVDLFPRTKHVECAALLEGD